MDAVKIGSFAYFACNSCKVLDVKNWAHAKKSEDENGEAYYELVKWPTDHVCAPGASYHLVKSFRDKCHDAVSQDPAKSIPQIYKDIKEEICRDLTDDEKKSFLDEIPELHSMRPQLYSHRKKFVPVVDPNPCDLCGQTFLSVSALKIHEAAKHNIRPTKEKPICDVCGKIFTRSDHLNSHIAKVHLKNIKLTTF